MTLKETNDGDYFTVGSTRYRVMIVTTNGRGCRPELPDGDWGPHVFFDDSTVIKDYTPMKKHVKLEGLNVETHQLGAQKKEWYD